MPTHADVFLKVLRTPVVVVGASRRHSIGAKQEEQPNAAALVKAMNPANMAQVGISLSDSKMTESEGPVEWVTIKRNRRTMSLNDDKNTMHEIDVMCIISCASFLSRREWQARGSRPLD